MSTTNVHPNAAIGYNTATLTDRYEQGRPSYDSKTVYTILSACLDRIIEQYPKEQLKKNNDTLTLHIVEIGSGTGKFTRIVLGCCDEYVKNYAATTGSNIKVEFLFTCAEPVQAMREKFASMLATTSGSATSTINGNAIVVNAPSKSVRQLKLIEATAQSLPLLAGSVDVILAAQAFHWFSTLDALKEFHRVLQPHGALGLVWNYRDRSATLNNEIESTLDKVHVVDAELSDPSPRFASGKWRDVFSNQDYFSMPLNEQTCKDVMIQYGDAQMIIDRVLSTSSAARRSEDGQQLIRQRILDFLEAHPELNQNGQYAINNSTLLVWTFRKH